MKIADVGSEQDDVADQMAPARGKQQRRRTRRVLLDAGRSLIAAKGVAGLHVQAITE
jgi:AcrR family transcriptional regulator